MIGVERRKIWWTSGSRCEPHDGVGRSLGPTYRKSGSERAMARDGSIWDLLSLMANQKFSKRA
jgi:hypothetical protein